MVRTVGLRVIPNFLTGNDRDAARKAGKFDWHVWRMGPELITVVQNTDRLAPVGPKTNDWHKAPEGGAVDLLDFEAKLVELVNKFIGSNDRRRTDCDRQGVPEDLHGKRLHGSV